MPKTVYPDRKLSRTEINRRYRRKRKMKQQLGIDEKNVPNEVVVARHRIINKLVEDAVEYNNMDGRVTDPENIKIRSKVLELIKAEINVVKSLQDILDIVEEAEGDEFNADEFDNVVLMENAAKQAQKALESIPELECDRQDFNEKTNENGNS